MIDTGSTAIVHRRSADHPARPIGGDSSWLHSPWTVLAVGISAWMAVGLWATKHVASTLPARLGSEARLELERAGLSGSELVMDGRDALVEGALADDSLFPLVASLIGAVPGVRVVRPEMAQGAFVRIRWTPDSLVIAGRVPSGRAQALEEVARRIAGSRGVDNRAQFLALARIPPWWEGLEELEPLTRLMPAGVLRIDESIVSVDGDVPGSERSRVLLQLEGAFPGLQVVEDLEIPGDASELQAQIDRALGGSVIDFVRGDDRVTQEGQAALDRIAELLLGGPDIALDIVVHLDASGDPDVDRRRTEERARAIKDELTSRGVSSDRLRPMGAGSDAPQVDGFSARARLQNRRVELLASRTHRR